MTEQLNPELLPCAFCHSGAILNDNGENPTFFWVTCSNESCGIEQLGFDNKRSAIYGWNTRAEIECDRPHSIYGRCDNE